jgi:hypothetical protein
LKITDEESISRCEKAYKLEELFGLEEEKVYGRA